MIDDIPQKLEHQYGNLIPIQSFFGDQNDRELSLLMRYLLDIKDCENVRTIEKRWWRNTYV